MSTPLAMNSQPPPWIGFVATRFFSFFENVSALRSKRLLRLGEFLRVVQRTSVLSLQQNGKNRAVVRKFGVKSWHVVWR